VATAYTPRWIAAARFDRRARDGSLRQEVLNANRFKQLPNSNMPRIQFGKDGSQKRHAPGAKVLIELFFNI
jgi:hypothetical protein